MSNTVVLEKFSLIYLGIPIAIFLLNWIHLYISLPIVSYLLWYIYTQFKKLHPIDQKDFIEIDYLHLGFAILAIFVWLWFSGVGGFSYQNGDYQKHHAILHDLIRNQWPVTYEIGEFSSQKLTLVYYIAYYLPAALIGKFTSFHTAQFMMFAWTFIGLILALYWMFHLLGKTSFIAVVVFMLFSGLDLIGYSLSYGKLPVGGHHIEWWSKVWQFSAMTSQLYWVPQHAIVNWIVTPIFVFYLRGRVKTLLPLYFIFSFYWSPFITIGLSVYFVYSLFNKGWKDYLNIHTFMAPFLIFVPLCFYYLSRIPDGYKSLLISYDNLRNVFPVILIFLILEVGIFAAFLMSFIPKLGKKHRDLYKLTLYLLPFFTFYRLGMYNDFCMRGSMPAMYIIMFFVILYLHNEESIQQSLNKRLLILCLVIGSITSLQEISRSLINNEKARFGVRSVLQMDYLFAKQYIGRSNSFYFRYLKPDAKPLNVKISSKLRNVINEEN